MDKSKIMQRLMATFLEELEEHVRAFNQDLLALEKNPLPAEQPELFKTLFRSAHSLKGAARSVNVPLIEGACHRLEEILDKVRVGHTVLGPELIGLLFATVDAIEEAGMRLREQQDLADAPLAGLLPRLEAAAAGNPLEPIAPTLSAAMPPPPALDPPPRQEVPPPGYSPPRLPGLEPPLESSSGSGSVRVPAEKLDSLLARVGELLLAQRRLETRVRDLASVQEFIAHWKTEWKKVEPFFAKERTSSHGNGAGALLEKSTRMPKRAVLALRQTGENLRRLEKSLERLTTAIAGDCRLLEQVTRPLDDEVHRVRMLPFSEACAGLDRMVRDLAQAGNKSVELLIDGGDVELDRSILEGLKDPLRHLIRNAVDHGIEPPAERLRSGKSRQARIRVAAALRAGQVEVIVEDDGQGLNLEAIRSQARRRKLEEPADDRDAAQLIFQPGFSTASIITDVSGRGVGLDVVKNRVESLHGTVDLSFGAGQGVRFTLIVPLTLTTLRVVLVNAGGQTYAFAGTNVQRMVHVNAADIRTIAGRDVISLGGAPVALASLAAVLNPAAPAPEPSSTRIPVLIVVTGTTRMAFQVDELLVEQEVLIKSLGTRIRRAPLLAGATILPSGRVALVLNAANLVRGALQSSPLRSRRVETAQTAADVRKRLLVVEDSVTTRTLVKSILEAAGYEVATAVDGLAGWEFLQANAIDLVVSDVDMPNMDGFALTESVRGSPKFRGVPVVLVTARENESDKARGIAVGADAYLVKSAFDQRHLLETITQLL